MKIKHFTLYSLLYFYSKWMIVHKCFLLFTFSPTLKVSIIWAVTLPLQRNLAPHRQPLHSGQLWAWLFLPLLLKVKSHINQQQFSRAPRARQGKDWGQTTREIWLINSRKQTIVKYGNISKIQWLLSWPASQSHDSSCSKQQRKVNKLSNNNL